MRHRVLVVDDDPAVSDVVRRYLEQDGFEVALESDGLGALKAVDLHKPDLIVLDLMLGGIDGLEVCRRLRERIEADAAHPQRPLTVWGAGYRYEPRA